MEKYLFVTHCNSAYLTRASAMIISLITYSPSARVVLIYHDEETKKAFQKLNLNSVTIIDVEEVIVRYKELAIARTNRPLIEFLYCLSPFVVRFCFDVFKPERVFYVDADLFFFADPAELIDKELTTSVVLVSHNFPIGFEHLKKYGNFNVGWLQFNENFSGRQILEWWSNKCLDSTASDLEANVYGDQKYLDEIPVIFPGVVIRNSLGENLAPWNLKGRLLTRSNSSKFVDGNQLIYFHFSGLRLLKHGVILGLSHYSYSNSCRFRRLIFIPYLKALKKSGDLINPEFRFDKRKTSLKIIVKSIIFRDFSLYRV